MVRDDHERRQPDTRGGRLERVGQSPDLGRRTDIEVFQGAPVELIQDPVQPCTR